MKKLALHKVVVAAIASAFIAGDALAMGGGGAGGGGGGCDLGATSCPGHHQKQSNKRSNMPAHSYKGAEPYQYRY